VLSYAASRSQDSISKKRVQVLFKEIEVSCARHGNFEYPMASRSETRTHDPSLTTRTFRFCRATRQVRPALRRDLRVRRRPSRIFAAGQHGTADTDGKRSSASAAAVVTRGIDVGQKALGMDLADVAGRRRPLFREPPRYPAILTLLLSSNRVRHRAGAVSQAYVVCSSETLSDESIKGRALRRLTCRHKTIAHSCRAPCEDSSITAAKRVHLAERVPRTRTR